MRKYAVYGLAILLGLVFYGSAILKLAGGPAIEATFAHLGLADWRYFIAGLEIVCVTLLLLPRTQVVGFVLMASYMGGAMMAHLSHGELPFIPTAVLGLVWLFGYLRNPSLFAGPVAARKETPTARRHSRIQTV
jgi:hypothetical protein